MTCDQFFHSSDGIFPFSYFYRLFELQATDDLQSGHILVGEDTFQTVTIVPTETNPGEVSYVLIVQQPADGEGDKEKEEPEDVEDQDLTIYDFEDNEDPGTTETPVSVPIETLMQILLFYF